MTDYRELAQRQLDRLDLQPLTLEAFHGRRIRKARNRRIAAAAVGLAVAIAVVVVGVSVFRSSGQRPADEPTPTPSSELPPVLRDGEVLGATNGHPVAVDRATGTDRVLGSPSCFPPACTIDESATALSADGRWLAYEVLGPDSCGGYVTPCGAAAAGTWVADGLGHIHQVSDGCASAGPGLCQRDLFAWSPFGVALAGADNGEHPEIYTYDPSTGARTSLALPTGEVTAIAWSPDASAIAYAVGGESPGVFSLDVASGASVPLADRVSDVTDIEWSPDGSRLLLDDAVDGRSPIEVVNADGTGFRTVVDQGGARGPGSPAWSPDGTRIAYATTPRSNGSFTFEVWTIAPDGSDQIRVYGSDCCVDDWGGPVWSPDGTRVAFMDNSRGPRVWHVANADGSGSVDVIDRLEVDGWEQGS